MFTIQKKNKPVVLFYRSSVKSLLLLCFAVILIVYNEADLINSKVLKCWSAQFILLTIYGFSWFYKF